MNKGDKKIRNIKRQGVNRGYREDRMTEDRGHCKKQKSCGIDTA